MSQNISVPNKHSVDKNEETNTENIQVHLSACEMEDNPLCVTETNKSVFLRAIDLSPCKLTTSISKCKLKTENPEVVQSQSPMDSVVVNEKDTICASKICNDEDGAEIVDPYLLDVRINKNEVHIPVTTEMFETEKVIQENDVHFSSPLAVVYEYSLSQETFSQSTQNLVDSDDSQDNDTCSSATKKQIKCVELNQGKTQFVTAQQVNTESCISTMSSESMTPGGDCYSAQIIEASFKENNLSQMVDKTVDCVLPYKDTSAIIKEKPDTEGFLPYENLMLIKLSKENSHINSISDVPFLNSQKCANEPISDSLKDTLPTDPEDISKDCDRKTGISCITKESFDKIPLHVNATTENFGKSGSLITYPAFSAGEIMNSPDIVHTDSERNTNLSPKIRKNISEILPSEVPESTEDNVSLESSIGSCIRASQMLGNLGQHNSKPSSESSGRLEIKSTEHTSECSQDLFTDSDPETSNIQELETPFLLSQEFDEEIKAIPAVFQESKLLGESPLHLQDVRSNTGLPGKTQEEICHASDAEVCHTTETTEIHNTSQTDKSGNLIAVNIKTTCETKPNSVFNIYANDIVEADVTVTSSAHSKNNSFESNLSSRSSIPVEETMDYSTGIQRTNNMIDVPQSISKNNINTDITDGNIDMESSLEQETVASEIHTCLAHQHSPLSDSIENVTADKSDNICKNIANTEKRKSAESNHKSSLKRIRISAECFTKPLKHKLFKNVSAAERSSKSAKLFDEQYKTLENPDISGQNDKTYISGQNDKTYILETLVSLASRVVGNLEESIIWTGQKCLFKQNVKKEELLDDPPQNDEKLLNLTCVNKLSGKIVHSDDNDCGIMEIKLNPENLKENYEDLTCEKELDFQTKELSECDSEPTKTDALSNAKVKFVFPKSDDNISISSLEVKMKTDCDHVETDERKFDTIPVTASALEDINVSPVFMTALEYHSQCSQESSTGFEPMDLNESVVISSQGSTHSVPLIYSHCMTEVSEDGVETTNINSPGNAQVCVCVCVCGSSYRAIGAK